MLIFTFESIVVFKDWAFLEKTKVKLSHGVVLLSYNLRSYGKSLRYKHTPTHEKIKTNKTTSKQTKDVTSDKTKDIVLWSFSLSNNKKIYFCS